MKKLCLVFAMSLSFAMACRGSTVLWNVAGLGYDSYLGYILGVDIPDLCSSGANLLITKSPAQAVIKNNVGHPYPILGYSMLLVQTADGELVGHDLFANASGSFFQMYAPSGWPAVSETDLTVSLYDTIFLAFKFGDTTGPGFYGWIELGYNGAEVFVVNSAIETALSQGIYAGMPEPSAAFLVLSGTAFLLLRRRRITKEQC